MPHYDAAGNPAGGEGKTMYESKPLIRNLSNISNRKALKMNQAPDKVFMKRADADSLFESLLRMKDHISQLDIQISSCDLASTGALMAGIFGAHDAADGAYPEFGTEEASQLISLRVLFTAAAGSRRDLQTSVEMAISLAKRLFPDRFSYNMDDDGNVVQATAAAE